MLQQVSYTLLQLDQEKKLPEIISPETFRKDITFRRSFTK